MGFRWYLARIQLSRRWPAYLMLAVLSGVLGGASASLVAGARRSSTVVDRYFAAATHYDVNVYSALDRTAMVAIPGVVRADPGSYLAMNFVGPDGRTDHGINGAAVDMTTVDRSVRLLQGAFPSPQDPLAVAVNAAFVKEFGLGVGDNVAARFYAAEDADAMNSGVYVPHGPTYHFRIAAVVETTPEIANDEARGLRNSAYRSTNQMYVQWPFYVTNRDAFLNFGWDFSVQLAGGAADLGRFEAAVRAGVPEGDQSQAVFQLPTDTERRASLDTPVNLESLLLTAFGLVGALATTVVTLVALRVSDRRWVGEERPLQALGHTRRDLGAIAVLRVLPTAIGAAIVASVVAYFLSNRFPIGIGRRLEVSPGRRLDLPVASLTVVLIVMVTGLAAFVVGLAIRPAGESSRVRTTPAGWVGRLPVPTPLRLGAYLGFGRVRGRVSSSSRQVTVAGAAALAVAVGFGIVLTGAVDLRNRPASHGWPWDVVIGNSNFTLAPDVLTKLTGDSRIAYSTVAGYGQATIGSRSLEVLAIDPAGTAPPVVFSGRLPVAANEVALGTRLARETHSVVGSTVRFSVAGGEFGEVASAKDVTATVVGITLPPIFGESDLGEAAVVTFDAIKRAGGTPQVRFLLARLSGAPSAKAATLQALADDYTQEMLTDIVPARIANLYRVRWLPSATVAVAATLAAALLAYCLALSGRTRAAELAVLRALGMPISQVRGVLAAQGLVLALAMMAAGVPVGVLGGSVGWRVLAHQLGVGTGVVFPWQLALVVPAALAVGLAGSLIPGRHLRTTSVATVLRSD
jgi:hypothetical protein